MGGGSCRGGRGIPRAPRGSPSAGLGNVIVAAPWPLALHCKGCLRGPAAAKQQLCRLYRAGDQGRGHRASSRGARGAVAQQKGLLGTQCAYARIANADAPLAGQALPPPPPARGRVHGAQGGCSVQALDEFRALQRAGGGVED